MIVNTKTQFGVDDSLMYMGVLIILQEGCFTAKDVYDIYGAKLSASLWSEADDCKSVPVNREWWTPYYGSFCDSVKEYDTNIQCIMIDHDIFWGWVKKQLPTPKSRLSIDVISSALKLAGVKQSIQHFCGLQHVVDNMLYDANDNGISRSTKRNELYLKVNKPLKKSKAPKPKTMTKGYCNAVQRATLDYAIEIVENWFGIKLTIQYATYDAQRDTFVKMGLSAEDILAASEGRKQLGERLPLELHSQVNAYFTGWWNSANKVRPVD